MPGWYRKLTSEQREEMAAFEERMSRYGNSRERIRQIVDGAPPLTEQQKSAISLLLHAGNALGQEGDQWLRT